jgi:hypothetical protein
VFIWRAKPALPVMDYFLSPLTPNFYFTLVTQSHERMFVSSNGCGTLHTAFKCAWGLGLLFKAC